jgi:CheY-like chemotaxis protein
VDGMSTGISGGDVPSLVTHGHGEQPSEARFVLNDFDGLEVMRQIRINQPTVRAVFLTAKDAASGRIAGLTAGGDDYVTKPFSLEGLMSRTMTSGRVACASWTA